MDAVQHSKKRTRRRLKLSKYITGESVLPHNAIRDTIALTFVLLAIPRVLSCFIFLTYILSGSSKFIGGKLISRHFRRSVRLEETFWKEAYSEPAPRRNQSYRAILVGSSIQVFSINVVVLAVIHYSFPRILMKYLFILAHSILASELIGSPPAHNVQPASQSPQSALVLSTSKRLNHSSNASSSSSASVLLIKTGSTKRGVTLWNMLTSFCSVVYVNYLVHVCTSNIDFQQVQRVAWNMLSNSGITVFRLKISSGNNSDSLLKRYMTSALAGSSFENTLKKLLFWSYFSKARAFWEVLDLKELIPTSIVKHTSRLRPCIISHLIHSYSNTFRVISDSLDYFYLVLCIIVITLEITPALEKSFFLRNYSRSLDYLSWVTPGVPIHFRKQLNVKTPLFLNSLNLSTTSVNEDCILGENTLGEISKTSKKDIIQIDLSDISSRLENVSDDNDFVCSPKGVSVENFETFCMNPFWDNKDNYANGSSLLVKKVGPGEAASTKLTTSVKGHPTSDLEESKQSLQDSSTISSQPFWKLLAAIIVMFKDPAIFSSGLINKSNIVREQVNLKLTAKYIGGCKAVFKIANSDEIYQLVSKGNFKITLNNIQWNLFGLYASQSPDRVVYLVVYGLSPLFQYEMSLICENNPSKYFACFRFNTISSDSKNVLTESSEFSELSTLRNGLYRASEDLLSCKNRLRKMKKDENKRISDTKKDIEIIKNRITKYNSKHSNEHRVSGKIKGLQHTVMQLEHQIADMELQLAAANHEKRDMRNNYKRKEEDLEKRISELDSFIHSHEDSITEYRNKFKAMEDQVQHVRSKRKRLELKVGAREDEIQRLQNEIKFLKKTYISGKINRKNKKIQEKFELILPKVNEATLKLQEEFEDFLANE